MDTAALQQAMQQQQRALKEAAEVRGLLAAVRGRHNAHTASFVLLLVCERVVALLWLGTVPCFSRSMSVW